MLPYGMGLDREKTNKKKNGDGDKNLDNRIMRHERLESLGALPLVESRAYSLTFFFFFIFCIFAPALK